MSRVIQGCPTRIDLVLQARDGPTRAAPLPRRYAESPLTCRWQWYRRYRKSCWPSECLCPEQLISGFIRLLPSTVTGPRLLKEAMVSVPVFRAPTV